jgi:hypothetical protein
MGSSGTQAVFQKMDDRRPKKCVPLGLITHPLRRADRPVYVPKRRSAQENASGDVPAPAPVPAPPPKPRRPRPPRGSSPGKGATPEAEATPAPAAAAPAVPAALRHPKMRPRAVAEGPGAASLSHDLETLSGRGGARGLLRAPGAFAPESPRQRRPPRGQGSRADPVAAAGESEEKRRMYVLLERTLLDGECAVKAQVGAMAAGRGSMAGVLEGHLALRDRLSQLA